MREKNFSIWTMDIVVGTTELRKRGKHISYLLTSIFQFIDELGFYTYESIYSLYLNQNVWRHRIRS